MSSPSLNGNTEEAVSARLTALKSIAGGESIFAAVTTTRFLLLVNLDTKQVVPLQLDRPEYYGISWFPGSQDLVLSHSMLDNSTLNDLSSYARSETGILSCGTTTTPPFLSAPHQILCGSDNRVICTNTGRNAIAVVDLAKPGHFQEARISAARWDRLSPQETTGDHLNSVFEKEGLLYVMAHRFTKGSILATLSYPDLKVLELEPIKNRTGLHNIWITPDQQRISCDSETGALVELNKTSTSILWSSGSAVYTRGLAATADLVLVGESQKLGRDLRGSSLSGLWLLDRKNWQALDYYSLGPYGAVQDVRLLNVADEAHHGHPFAGLEALLARDLPGEIAADRVEISRAAQKHKQAWELFDLVYGTPVFDKKGARIAQTVCFLAQASTQGNPGRHLDFRYALDPSRDDSHVAVASYRGQGQDTDMHALLLQPTDGKRAHLNLWIQDGSTWKVQPGFVVSDLPLEAKINAYADSGGIQLHVDGKLISSIPAAHWRNGALGIRWCGASISLPVDQPAIPSIAAP